MVFGVLGIVAVPAAVVAAQMLTQVTLLQGLYIGTPVSVGCGLLALLADPARETRGVAKRRRRRSATPGQGEAWAGLYVGVTAAVALGVYGVLVGSQ